MKIVEAQQIIEDELGRDAELIQAKQMRFDILIIITEDVAEYETSFGRKLKQHTRRLSIFQMGKKIGGFIISTSRG